MNGVGHTLSLAGRLHPLLVHLPIGLLVLLVFLEVLARFPRFQRANASCGYILALAIPAAACSALLGYWLSLAGGYHARLLQLHLWTGFATAGFLFIAGLLFWSGKKILYRSTLAVSFLALIAASHFGGSLTHGSDYLAHFFPGPLKSLARLGATQDPPSASSSAAPVSDQSIFATAIHPILENKCSSCHGEEKSKGSLRLDSYENLVKGGESGPIVLEGNAAASLLIKRLSLPLHDENHMPPEGKPQPSAQDLALLRWWIDSGASPDKKAGDLKPPTEVARILAERTASQPTPATAQLPPRPFPEILPIAGRLASELGIVVSRISETEPWIQCSAAIAGTAFDDAALAKLSPLAANLRWLDLGGTKISDAGLAHVGRMSNLQRLHLERTRITDARLSALAGLHELEYLNLYGTEVTDAALPKLESLSNLKRLFIWQTRVTPEAAKSFADARSNQDEVAAWQQQIEELKAKIATAGLLVDLGLTNSLWATNAPAMAAKPMNTECPISGKPIDVTKTVLHEGKLVAFCCDDCKAKFVKNPAHVLAKLAMIQTSAALDSSPTNRTK